MTSKVSYLETRTAVQFIEAGQHAICSALPVHTYELCENMQGLYLAKRDALKPDDLIYGDAFKHVDLVFTAFQQREKTTGVILYGTKGMGKTQFTKRLAQHSIEKDTPVILINHNFGPAAICSFLSNVSNCVVIFDEFEKHFDEEEQGQLLSAFDGQHSNKKLMVIVTNNWYGINEFYKDRLSRILYKFRYTSLPKEVIRQYLDDQVANKELVESAYGILSMMGQLNYDVLKEVVSEINRTNLPLVEIIDFLNIDQFGDMLGGEFHAVVLDANGVEVDQGTVYDLGGMHPLAAKRFRINGEKISSRSYHTVKASELVDQNEDRLVYATKSKEGVDYRVIVTRKEDETRDVFHRYRSPAV